MRQFFGRNRRRLHIGGGFVECMHGAFGALRRLFGRTEQSTGRLAHCGGATADAGEQLLDLRAERGDRRVDCRAALFLAADGGAFLFGAALLGDILMRGNPAAAGQRLVLGEHDAAVAGRNIVEHLLALGHLLHDLAAVRLDVALEQACILAMLEQLCERTARLHDVRRQAVHVEIAPVEQRDAALPVEYVEALRHIVDRVGQPSESRRLAPLKHDGGCQGCDARGSEQHHLACYGRWQNRNEHPSSR